MTYELDKLKFPEGLFRTARDNKMLKPLVFWYRLKPIYSSGKFEIKSFVRTVQSFYKISRTNIKFHMDILLNCGLIKKYGNYYQLISYDKLFKHFGYDVSFNGRRMGNFAIDNVDVEFIPVLEDRVDCGEINLNLYRQGYCLQEIASDEVVSKTGYVMKDVRNEFFYDMTNTQLSKEAISSAVQNLYKYKTPSGKIQNIVTGISCRGLCKLLGFKSTKSVHDLKYRSVKHGLIELVNQTIRFRNFCGFSEEVLLKRFLRPDFNFKGKFGKPLEYQLCDDFIFCFE